MSDIVRREKRSEMMAGIRGKDTVPEMLVRAYLHSSGFRYRLHSRELPGSPDLVLKRYGAVIFVHGCFWHRHSGCRYAATPATRREFWLEKLEANRARDKRAQLALLSTGWRVAVVWECSLKHAHQLTLDGLREFIQSNRRFVEFSLIQEPKME
ncbi:TPA: DNA mismatch endonuclease Vsr [Stenotrophomonas maltophilia]|uniref:very short patch repair endonuclease n=1 Tax=Stenotrophomonas maltophilia TaxID=40324 RepID=UPI0016587568|nr:very short patch repair endonuclease [Stenotrophomonas maltophilia]MBC9117418.1 DNA mismatch endonuclease Vsr [Stenotrophomonas maltophilia]HEL3007236.1 DNA mismatch endonuclease Vsr [Stenotrophomonas maltophilia]HEL4204588.1 DNA mismatch endonuclease Vsr [Stenotrophomonas maltophilia]